MTKVGFYSHLHFGIYLQFYKKKFTQLSDNVSASDIKRDSEIIPDEDLRMLVLAMLEADPAERMTINEAKQHSLFATQVSLGCNNHVLR